MRSYHQDLAGADQATVGRILGAHVTPDYRWRGVHPFNELEGVEAVANSFWTPGAATTRAAGCRLSGLGTQFKKADVKFSQTDRVEADFCSIVTRLSLVKHPSDHCRADDDQRGRYPAPASTAIPHAAPDWMVYGDPSGAVGDALRIDRCA